MSQVEKVGMRKDCPPSQQFSLPPFRPPFQPFNRLTSTYTAPKELLEEVPQAEVEEEVRTTSVVEQIHSTFHFVSLQPNRPLSSLSLHNIFSRAMSLARTKYTTGRATTRSAATNARSRPLATIPGSWAIRRRVCLPSPRTSLRDERHHCIEPIYFFNCLLFNACRRFSKLILKQVN